MTKFKTSLKVAAKLFFKRMWLVYQDERINVYNNSHVKKIYDVIIINKAGNIVLEYTDSRVAGVFETKTVGVTNSFYRTTGFFPLDLSSRDIFFNPEEYRIFAPDPDFTYADKCCYMGNIGEWIVLRNHFTGRFIVKDLEDVNYASSPSSIDTDIDYGHPYDNIEVFDDNLMIAYDKRSARYFIYCKSQNDKFGLGDLPYVFETAQLATCFNDKKSFIVKKEDCMFFIPENHILQDACPCAKIWMEKNRVYGILEDSLEDFYFNIESGYITYRNEFYLTDFFGDVRFKKSNDKIVLMNKSGKEVVSFTGEFLCDFAYRSDFSPIISGYFATVEIDGEERFISPDGFFYHKC